MAGNVTRAEVNEEAVRVAEEHFGRLDAVVLSAGIAGWGHIEIRHLDVFDRVMEVNVRACRCCERLKRLISDRLKPDLAYASDSTSHST